MRGRLVFEHIVPVGRLPVRGGTVCEICGAELPDASQRLCGGDRCHRVFMKHADRPGPAPAAGDYRLVDLPGRSPGPGETAR